MTLCQRCHLEKAGHLYLTGFGPVCYTCFNTPVPQKQKEPVRVKKVRPETKLTEFVGA